MRIVIVTGLSGAGKSTALRALEDYGYYCVDNAPLPLIGQMINWMVGEGDIDELALAIDARQHPYLDGYREEVERLAAHGHRVEVLYLEASDASLVRRYSTTRRRHPLSGTDLMAGIRRDRVVLAELRRIGTVIDTTNLNVHQLKGIIQDRYGDDAMGLAVMLQSFGFRHGVPNEANMVFDVRFLPNPYFVTHLTEHDGRDADVAQYVLDTDEGRAILTHVESMLRFALPQFQKERKLYLTVAIGCTGGRHRSVALVEALATRLRPDWDVLIKHRDLDVRN